MQKHYTSKRNKRRRSHGWGIAAEYLCAAFLFFKGYSLIKLRYRNHSGEIDIIATKGKILVFIEVKARAQKETALYSISPAKQQIISSAARGFIAVHAKFADLGLRFDVMVVTSPLKIHHLKNAWRPE